MIALSCGIKISAVRHLVLSQSTRMTDRRTDGRTDRITTSKTALAYARAVIKLVLQTTNSAFKFGKKFRTTATIMHFAQLGVFIVAPATLYINIFDSFRKHTRSFGRRESTDN